MSAHRTLSANVWNGSVRLVSGNLGLFLGIRRTLPFRRLAKKVPCAECRRRQNPWTRKWAFLSLPMKFKVTWPCLTSSLLWHSIIKGPVQSKSMFISIDQLPKMIEFHKHWFGLHWSSKTLLLAAAAQSANHSKLWQTTASQLSYHVWACRGQWQAF